MFEEDKVLIIWESDESSRYMDDLAFLNINCPESSRLDLQGIPLLLFIGYPIKGIPFNLGSHFVLRHDPFVNLFPMDGRLTRSLDSQSDLLPFDIDHVNIDCISNRNLFTDSSR